VAEGVSRNPVVNRVVDVSATYHARGLKRHLCRDSPPCCHGRADIRLAMDGKGELFVISNSITNQTLPKECASSTEPLLFLPSRLPR
jgi:hypothetical protein